MRGILKSLSVASLALATAFVFTACDQGGTSKPTGKTYKLGIVAKSRDNPVFSAAHTGFKDRAVSWGKDHGVTIEVDIQTPQQEDATKQAAAIEALTRAGVHGIAVSATDAKTLVEPINRAIEKGIVVMCFDSDVPESKRMCYYGTDDVTCGEKVVQELAKSMGDKGTVVILGGHKGAPNLTNRIKGAKQELAKHPNMKLVAASEGVLHHEESPEAAAAALDQFRVQNPGIQGWAMIGGWPLFVKDALKWPAGSIKVVSVDALPAQIPYVQSGFVDVLWAQDCYGWGAKSVELLMEKIVDGKSPSETRIIDPLTKVTKDTADGYMKKWDTWLGK